jgi:pimeloyl-ACP methyl ester carboxylesterase
MIEVSGGSLYVEDAGRGAALVFLHGGFGDRRMWDDQFQALAGSFRVIRYDHRGFGRSPAPSGEYSPVADLTRVLDALGVTRAHLVGNSMGGQLALDFALVEPDRADRIVVIASGAGGFPFPAADVERVMAVFAVARERGTGAAAETWLRHPMVAVASTSNRNGTAVRLRQMVEENQRIFLMEQWPEERTVRPAYERLPDIKAAVLFVIGDRDAPAVQNAARATAERLPGARVEVVAGADHLPQMEEPEQVNRIIQEFVGL